MYCVPPPTHEADTWMKARRIIKAGYAGHFRPHIMTGVQGKRVHVYRAPKGGGGPYLPFLVSHRSPTVRGGSIDINVTYLSSDVFPSAQNRSPISDSTSTQGCVHVVILSAVHAGNWVVPPRQVWEWEWLWGKMEDLRNLPMRCRLLHRSGNPNRRAAALPFFPQDATAHSCKPVPGQPPRAFHQD